MSMAGLERITGATLDVLDFLLVAHQDKREVYGWEIKKATRRSGPTVYGIIDRLEDANLLVGRWEDQDPSSTGPRRRYYYLTGAGVTTASALLAERREQRAQVRVRPLSERLVTDYGRPT